MRRHRIRKINTYISNKAGTACHKTIRIDYGRRVRVGVADHKPVMSARRSLVNWLTHITQPYSRVLYKYNTHTYIHTYIGGRSLYSDRGRQAGATAPWRKHVCRPFCLQYEIKPEVWKYATSLTGCPPLPQLAIVVAAVIIVGCWQTDFSSQRKCESCMWIYIDIYTSILALATLVSCSTAWRVFCMFYAWQAAAVDRRVEWWRPGLQQYRNTIFQLKL